MHSSAERYAFLRTIRLVFCGLFLRATQCTSRFWKGLDGSNYRLILHHVPPSRLLTMPRLEVDIHALPVSEQARAFLLIVADQRSWTRTAETQARMLGLRNRDALRCLLLSLNLPQWGVLKRWFRVYALVAEAEHGSSFARLALKEGHNPSSTYRTLKGLLKMEPGAILQRGGTALLLPELIRELDRIRGSLQPRANRSAG